jgi:hypothetical protein
MLAPAITSPLATYHAIMYPFTTTKPLVVLALTILLISTFGLFWIPPSQSSRYTVSTSHFPSLRPALRPVKFAQRPEFFDLTPAGDGNWTALLPPNGGFVSERTGEGGFEMAGITMFHQLHCLQMIREAFQDLMEGKKVLESEMDDEDEMGAGDVGKEHGVKRKRSIGKRHGPHLDQDHWVHCLDYLMQVSRLACSFS